MTQAPINFSTAKSADIPMADIIVDLSFNSRSNLDSSNIEGTKVVNLKDSLNSQGQVTPVLVERRTQGKKEKYYLISGFRRFHAMKDLGWENVSARVFEPMSESARRYLNLLENTARQDLSSYDLAIACKSLNDIGETSENIALKIGKSDSYVRALTLAAKQVVPNILSRWKRECEPSWSGVTACSTDWLAKVRDMKPDDQESELIKRLEGKTKKGDPDWKPSAAQAGAGEGTGEDKPKVKKRVTAPQMETAKIAIMEKVRLTDDATVKASMEVALGVLRWALGDSEVIPGIYNPEQDKPAVTG